jgi:hypothetical protein
MANRIEAIDEIRFSAHMISRPSKARKQRRRDQIAQTDLPDMARPAQLRHVGTTGKVIARIGTKSRRLQQIS